MRSHPFDFDPQKIWEYFFEKYTPKSSNLSLPGTSFFTPEKNETKYTPETAKEIIKVKAKKTMLKIREAKQKNSLNSVPLNIPASHASLLEFANHQALAKSLDVALLTELNRAIDVGDWQAEIFTHPQKKEYIPYLSINLFEKNRITEQQFHTIIYRHNIIKNYSPVKYCRILDENGEFTEDAVKYLLPYIKPLPSTLNQHESILEMHLKFKLLVKALPKSENSFLLTDLGKYANKEPPKILDTLMTPNSGLAPFCVKENYFYHLSNGAFDAFGIAKYGIDEYVRPTPRLDKQTKEDIQNFATIQKRVQETRLPGTFAAQELHGFKDPDDFEAIIHDRAHAQLISAIPLKIRAALMRMTEITRKNFELEWSKEIWTWVDCDFPYFYMFGKFIPGQNLISETTIAFTSLLNFGNYTENESTKSAFLFENIFSKVPVITPVGINIFLDMIENQSEWSKFNINPQFITSYDALKIMDDYYKKHQDFFKEANPKLKIFIFQLFFLLPKKEREAKISNFIDFLKDSNDISANITFAKSKGLSYIQNNRILTNIDGSPLTPEKAGAFLSEIISRSPRKKPKTS